MKIAFISQPFDRANPPIENGSIQIWTYQVTRRLAQTCNITIYSIKGAEEQKQQSYAGVKYKRLSFIVDKWLLRLLKISRIFSSDIRKPFHASSFFFLWYIIQAALDIRKQACDVVHIHNYSQFVPIVRTINPRIKIVLHMHGEWLTQLDRSLIKQRLRHVDIVIGCSDYLISNLNKAIPELTARTKTVYNGVDIEHFHSNGKHHSLGKEKQFKLLFVGRHSPEKGVHNLLDAVKELVKIYPEIHLTIVGPKYVVPQDVIVAMNDDPKVQALTRFYGKDSNGEDTYLSHLEKQRQAGLEKNVTFTGSVPHSQLRRLYQEADIVINPSLSETFGLSLVEAMASEIPVVATRVGGMVEVIEDGKSGLLVEAENPTMLAKTIETLLANETLRKKMGTAGRQRVENLFSWEKIAESLMTVYREL